jgi:hypothetical protein
MGRAKWGEPRLWSNVGLIMTDSIKYSEKGPFKPEEIQELFQSAGFDVQPLSRILGAISGSTTYISATAGDKLVGFVYLPTIIALPI